MSDLSITPTILALMFAGVYCLDVIPETVKLVYFNKKYIENAGVNVRRYGRHSPYYINMWGDIKETSGNNLTINVILTEYLHNEYRRSFIEFHYKLCDLINIEPYIGGMLKKVGITCPLVKGKYNAMNMTLQTQNFPNVFPFEKGGADIEAVVTATGEKVATGFLHAKFIQKKTLKN